MRSANGSVPLYARLRSTLKSAIGSGEFAPGQKLPTELELELAHGVSRSTVRRALDELERDGLIRRRQGRPARVTDQLVSLARTEIRDDLAALLDLVRGTDTRILAFVREPPSVVMRALLELGDGELVLRADRLRSVDGRPMMHSSAHVPAFIGARRTEEGLRASTMVELMQDAGVKIADAAQVMRAEPCDETLADLLGMRRGEPVFRMERLLRDERGRPIQHLVLTFPWDRFCYRVSSTALSNGKFVEMTGSASAASVSLAREGRAPRSPDVGPPAASHR